MIYLSIFITFLIALVKALQKHGTTDCVDHCMQGPATFPSATGIQNTPPHHLGKISLLGHSQNLHPKRILSIQQLLAALCAFQ